MDAGSVTAGTEISFQHRHNVAAFSGNDADECVMCRFIKQCLPLERAHLRFRDLSEASHEFMKLEYPPFKPFLASENVSWGLLEVWMNIPKHALSYTVKISIATCRAEGGLIRDSCSGRLF